MYTVLRQTIRKRLQAKLRVKAELQRRRHAPIPEQGKWLQRGCAWTPSVIMGCPEQPGAALFSMPSGNGSGIVPVAA